MAKIKVQVIYVMISNSLYNVKIINFLLSTYSSKCTKLPVVEESISRGSQLGHWANKGDEGKSGIFNNNLVQKQ